MSERQIIDAQGRFVGGLAPSPASPSTSSYLIISVVGCQSGGKSTLLNTAFGTDFPVLDAPKVGRRRTTLGVWGVATPATAQRPALVVLDVEGTDSRERGEGAVSFESRTSLFALAVSDAVLVNMWAHDVGRHTAANYDLFETVFSRTEAAPRDSRVALVVVVRDCEDPALVPNIRRVLVGDLRNIWTALSYPPSQFDTRFDLRVVALPHKVYAPEDFETQAKELARTIATEGSLKTRKQPVPLVGFDTFARHVWLTICKATGGDGHDAEFTLDLPRHVALTAHFKCGELVTAIFDGAVGGRIEELRTEIESEWRKPVPEFGAKVDAIARDAFEEYDRGTAAYRASGLAGEAVIQRRTELGQALGIRLSEVRERYLCISKEFCMNGFEDEFRPMLGGTSGYERNAKRLANSFVGRYRALLDGARLPSTVLAYIDSAEVLDKKEPRSKSGNDEGLGVNIETLDLNDDYDDDDYGLESRIDNGDSDTYSDETFKKEVFRLVEERRRLGELMLPAGSANFAAAGPKQDPWWKGLLIRGVILLINYLQASHGQRAALNLHRKQEKEFPPVPTF